MFGSFGVAEILLVVVILVFFFGARRIPEIARGLGSGIRNFKGALKEGGDREPEGEDDRIPPPDDDR